MVQCVVWLLLMLQCLDGASPLNTARTKTQSYQILHTNTSCTSDLLKVTVELNRDFHGVLYAKGFPLEKSCRSVGNNEKLAQISLNASSCGVRLVPVDVSK